MSTEIKVPKLPESVADATVVNWHKKPGDAVTRDENLADLETEVPDPVAGAVNNPTKAEALGWLFVSEGSKLGAAFLIKRAVGLGLSETFGARHLAEPAGGRAEGWKSFVKTLDGLELSAQEEAELDKGAIDAFNRFTVLLEQAYATAPETA